VKTILIAGFLLPGLISQDKTAFTVDIFDYDHSMAYTIHYHVTHDSVCLEKLNGLVGGHSVYLLQQKLPEKKVTIYLF